MRARRGADRRGAVGDPLARGARRRVHARERRLPPRPLRRRVAQAPAPGRRPHRATRSRRRCATPWEAGSGTTLRERAAPRARARARTAGARAAASTRSTRRPSSSPPAAAAIAVAEERGELSTNHPGATGEVTQIALDLGAEARDLDALQYHPNGGAWPPNMQGYSIPETTRAYGAVLLNADGEEFTDSLGPRDVVSAGDLRRGREGQRRGDARRPAGGLPRHDAHRARPTPRSRCRTCCAATAAAGIDPLAEKILTYPVLHYQNGGLVIDTRRRDDARGRSTPAARSPAARTGATA